MPIELQIIKAQEFIRLGTSGHFDLEASKAVLATLAAACRKRGVHQALLDVRSVVPGEKPVFSPKDLIELVNTFEKAGFKREDRLAVLYGSDPHHRASLLSFVATVRGWQVRAFNNFERAIFWLSSAFETPLNTDTATIGPRKVRIRKASRKKIVKPGAEPVIKIRTAPAKSL